jgi:hypothetical protein
MKETTLARVIEILQTDPDPYVPVRRLWLTLRDEGVATDLDLTNFQAQLAVDDRFELVEAVPEFASDAQGMGFLGEPSVKLAARQVTTEEVLHGLTQSLAQLTQALQEAWVGRPDGDLETEGMLQQALEMAEQLERDVQQIIEPEDEQAPQEVDEP